MDMLKEDFLRPHPTNSRRGMNRLDGVLLHFHVLHFRVLKGLVTSL
jgi:hypothetical protein